MPEVQFSCGEYFVQQVLSIVANQRSAKEIFYGECENAPANSMLGQNQGSKVLSALRTSREVSDFRRILAEQILTLAEAFAPLMPKAEVEELML